MAAAFLAPAIAEAQTLGVRGDFDGDGQADVAVYRRTTGEWFVLGSRDGGPKYLSWGAPTLEDVPVPADYDGDGQVDVAVYRRATGQWFILRSTMGYAGSVGRGAPALEDVPVPADYDGDGGADIAVYRRGSGQCSEAINRMCGCTTSCAMPRVG